MLERLFHLRAHGTSVRQECLAGLTTFMAMCYIILVVPDLLADTGIPHDAATAATIWITILSTLVMGLWAQFPVGVAPGLGLTAYFAYYVCGPAGYAWQTGLGAVLISGIIFTLLTVTRVRQMIIDAVPRDLKYAIIVGIGAFIAFIGMKNSGLVIADSSTFVTLGDLSAAPTLLSAAGVLLIGVLTAHRIPGAMIIGIATISVSGLLLGISPMPSGPLLSLDIPLPTETIGQLDLAGALHHGLFSIIFTLTIVDLFDNMGTLIGLAHKAGFTRPDGRIDNLDRALITDSLSTITSALLGATTATSYLESAAGVAQGGRTGLTAVVIAGLFALTLFFTPLASIVPSYATAPVLIIVGAYMMQDVVNIRFSDFMIALPAFLTIITMPLTFNIATGFGFGFIAYVVLRLLSGRWREVSPILYIVAACFAINFLLRSL